MRVRVDQAGEQRRPGQRDLARRRRYGHARSRPDRGDAITADEHDPTVSIDSGGRIEDARWHQQHRCRIARCALCLRGAR